MRLSQEPGGAHGTHCLRIHNFEDQRWTGAAQDGKFLRNGVTYRFRGRLQNLGDADAEVEVRLYPTNGLDWNRPMNRVRLGRISTEERVYTAEFTHTDQEGWGTFALFVSPGSEIRADALSLMPGNAVKGFRPEAIEVMKRIHPGLIRFPGGCFASFHMWKDAIGPFDRRRPKPSYQWGDCNFNDVGTKEFLELCEAIGSEAMLVVNLFHPDKRYFLAGHKAHGYDLRHITDLAQGAQVAADWVAYCNAPVTHPMGRLRAEHGHPEPVGVQYWEMDNEGYHWFSPEEYGRAVVQYAQAMKAVDPTILIGVTSYHRYAEAIEEILGICGEHVDFLADRMCEENNSTRKIAFVKAWNTSHDHKLFYADTEALQHRQGALDPYTAWCYARDKAGMHTARRTWTYALTLASNLMAFQRCGGLARFMCFNNLANTAGQSCVEFAKEQVVLTPPGYVLELVSRSEAAWPMKLVGYEPGWRKTVQVQAAWDRTRTKLVVYLLNRGPRSGTVTLDLTALDRLFGRQTVFCLYAADALTEEIVKSHGNIHRVDRVLESADLGEVLELEMPKFSFTEVVLE